MEQLSPKPSLFTWGVVDVQLFILNASASVTLIINYLGKKYALSVNCFNFNRLKAYSSGWYPHLYSVNLKSSLHTNTKFSR